MSRLRRVVYFEIEYDAYKVEDQIQEAEARLAASGWKLDDDYMVISKAVYLRLDAAERTLTRDHDMGR